ncbi:MAG: AraC family transcriptional regulator [Lachnospiraceae bacterium]|nr:AraC family transcriptional regulator [Lachnospiraceae bacterium]
MHLLSKERGLYGPEVKLIAQTDDGATAVYKIETDGGEGIMTGFEVFPGIEIIYNDFHTCDCFIGKPPASDIMEINHCKQGRFECDFHNGLCAYLEEGDLSVNMLGNRTKNAYFPLEHYKGVSVIIDIAKANRSISSVLSDISIDLYALRDKLCPNNQCFIMRATVSIEHIFSELYTVPDEVKSGYFKLKVLELLLFLSVVDSSECLKERTYFNKRNVQTIKVIKNYMVEHLELHFTLEELSSRFGIPLTTMKLCFKGLYGTSIYAYMRSYRMQVAASLLCKSNESISCIAGKLGYINASKFSYAFKDIMEFSPLEYRKRNHPIK